MGFRGVLLSIREGENDSCFRIISPDACLQLPTSSVPRDAPHIVEQKMLITDYVTSELQQVTRLSGVTLQRDTRSALWVAMEPIKTDPLDDLSSMAGSLYPFGLQTLVKRVCYCFHFQAEIEFDLFERAHAAARRLQQCSLLENSVRMEIEIQQHLQEKSNPKKSTSNVPARTPISHEELKQRREKIRKQLQERIDVQKQASAIRRQADEMAAVRAKAQSAQQKQQPKPVKETKDREPIASSEKKKKTTTLPTPKTTSSSSTTVTEQCVLCGSDGTCRSVAGSFVKHPYVLKDGRGAAVMVCKICLQRVLKKRITWERSRGVVAVSTKDALCGLCAEPTDNMEGDIKACTHPQCPRVYCTPCLKILFGKAQMKKVGRTHHWKCPNCTLDGEAATAADEQQQPAADDAAEESVSMLKKKKKKRKRESATTEAAPQNPAAAPLGLASSEDPSPPPIDVDTVVAYDPKTGKTMTLVDYASTYYKFLIEREAEPQPPDESEDSCFCCKDGGDVMECDFRHGKLRCPKVYHQDCLGFEVPENKEWVCPRHRCFKCGFTAQFACRFCVTSFCKEHLPHDIKKLGPGSAEIQSMAYVLCGACDHMSLKAVEKRKISADLFDKLLHPPAPRPPQRAAPKQKKRARS